MLQTLIRLMGAWVIVEGGGPSVSFAGVFSEDPTTTEILVGFLPAIAGVILGTALMVFAPRLAPKGVQEYEKAPAATDMLIAGMILLGIYWLGNGLIYSISSFSLYSGIAREELSITGIHTMIATSHLVTLAGGITLIIIGTCMLHRRNRMPVYIPADSASGSAGT